MRLPTVLALVGLCLVAATAAAQSGFRVTQAVGRATPTHTEVGGTVTNETRAEAINISVTVEALGADHKVLARGIAFVTSRLPGGATASYTAKVPIVAGVSSYRTAVTSFRFIQGPESP